MERIKRKMSLIIIFILIIQNLIFLLNANSYAQSIDSDISKINNSIYPGIKDRINALKSKYPNWKFKVLYTDLNWNDVITNEYVGHNSGPRNMVEAVGDRQGAWICSVCSYKYGNWRCASQSAIAYMMDPRNSLNADDIFQFEELTTNTATEDTIKTSVKGTFLQGHEKEIINSANKTGINGYYIVARLIQEQSSKGSVLSDGSKGYYNPFNIQAIGNTDAEVITNGINYAKKQGWDTLEKGIIGGINFISSEYIKKGQNTLYLQKFDVESSANGLYWHQYMQNLMAAQSEGAKLRNTYEKINAINSSHTFIIPVYKNMPVSACARPSGTTSSKVSGDIVKVNVNSSICLRKTPNGTIIGNLYKDEIVTRIEKATSKISNTYWDKVRKADGTEGYVARETYSDEANYKLYLVPINEEKEDSNSSSNSNTIAIENNSIAKTTKETEYPINTTKVKFDKSSNVIMVTPDAIAEDILTAYGGAIRITKSDKTFLNGAKEQLCTGFIVDDKYVVVKKGDVNGDGFVKATDYMTIKNYIMGISTLSEVQKKAADVNKDGTIRATDYMTIKNYIMNVSKIEV